MVLFPCEGSHFPAQSALPEKWQVSNRTEAKSPLPACHVFPKPSWDLCICCLLTPYYLQKVISYRHLLKCGCSSDKVTPEWVKATKQAHCVASVCFSLSSRLLSLTQVMALFITSSLVTETEREDLADDSRASSSITIPLPGRSVRGDFSTPVKTLKKKIAGDK